MRGGIVHQQDHKGGCGSPLALCGRLLQRPGQLPQVPILLHRHKLVGESVIVLVCMIPQVPVLLHMHNVWSIGESVIVSVCMFPQVPVLLQAHRSVGDRQANG